MESSVNHVILMSLCAIVVLTIVRVVFVVKRKFESRSVEGGGKRDELISTLVVLGSGGHTSEMMMLTSEMDPRRYALFFAVADSDATSAAKLRSRYASNPLHVVPRSREVMQSWITTVFTTLYATAFSFALVAKTRPDLVLCNGPGTCVPICFSAFILDVLGIKQSKIIFVESFARVDRLSLSGELLYYVSDRFVVQWPQLLNSRSHAQYIGILL